MKTRICAKLKIAYLELMNYGLSFDMLSDCFSGKNDKFRVCLNYTDSVGIQLFISQITSFVMFMYKTPH